MIALAGQIFCGIVAFGLLVLIGLATWIAFSKGIEVKNLEFWHDQRELAKREMAAAIKANNLTAWEEAADRMEMAERRLEMAAKDIIPD